MQRSRVARVALEKAGLPRTAAMTGINAEVNKKRNTAGDCTVQTWVYGLLMYLYCWTTGRPKMAREPRE